MATVDLAPIIQPLVQIAGVAVATIVGGFVAWAANALKNKFNIEIEQKKLQLVEDAMTKSVQGAGMMVEQLAHEKGWDHPEVKSEIVQNAARWFVEKFPDAVKASDFDPNSPGGIAKIQTAMRRVLPVAMVPVVDSPVTTYGPAQAPEGAPGAPAAL